MHRSASRAQRRRTRAAFRFRPGCRVLDQSGVRLLILVCLIGPLRLGQSACGAEPAGTGLERMLPGEFEKQDAILIGWQSRDPIIRQVLISIVSLASPNIPVLVLVDGSTEHADAAQALRLSGIAKESIHILMVPRDTIWIRDFGPIAVTTNTGRPQIIDLDYAGKRRRKDDRVPQQVARFLGMPLVSSGLRLEGGNLLSNGRGVLLTTSRILDQNFDRGMVYRDVVLRLRQLYGCRTPILLEPLDGEPTGHIDMFAAFTDASTVVVGELEPTADPLNSKLLDRNAQRLSAAGLRVVRLPMPDHGDGTWRSYTNVLFANVKLLVPTYSSTDVAGLKRALDIYRTLLPDWSIVPVDCTEVIRLGGALHCLSMNLAVIERNGKPFKSRFKQTATPKAARRPPGS